MAKAKFSVNQQVCLKTDLKFEDRMFKAGHKCIVIDITEDWFLQWEKTDELMYTVRPFVFINVKKNRKFDYPIVVVESKIENDEEK